MKPADFTFHPTTEVTDPEGQMVLAYKMKHAIHLTIFQRGADPADPEMVAKALDVLRFACDLGGYRLVNWEELAQELAAHPVDPAKGREQDLAVQVTDYVTRQRFELTLGVKAVPLRDVDAVEEFP